MTKKEALKKIHEGIREVASEFGLTFRYYGNSREAVFTLGECDIDDRGRRPDGRFGVGRQGDKYVKIDKMGNVTSCDELCINGFHSKFQYAVWDRIRELDILLHDRYGWVITGGKVYWRGKEVKR